MQILHVIATLDFAMGGPPVICSRLAAAQAAMGHSVYLAYHGCDEPDTKGEAQLNSIPGFELVQRVAAPRNPGIEAVLGRKAMALLTPTVAKADVVHVHGVWDMLVRVGAAAARRMGKPYVVLLNGMLDPWSMKQSALKKKIALALGYRKMLDGAAAIHCGNAEEARLIEPLKLKAPTVIIPNGVTLGEIDPLPAAGSFYSARPELRGRRYILFLSRLHYKKGLDYLADAFAKVAARHADVDLVVAGPNDGAEEELRSRLAGAGLSGRGHLIGPIYGREKLAALADAACFCLPSRQEGFSVAVLEAMACGCPVVVSENCHFPEAAASGAGFVVPLDVDRVAAALDAVLSDATAAREMGIKGRKLVEAKFTWPIVARETINLYQRLLGRGADGGSCDEDSGTIQSRRETNAGDAGVSAVGGARAVGAGVEPRGGGG